MKPRNVGGNVDPTGLNLSPKPVTIIPVPAAPGDDLEPIIARLAARMIEENESAPLLLPAVPVPTGDDGLDLRPL